MNSKITVRPIKNDFCQDCCKITNIRKKMSQNNDIVTTTGKANTVVIIDHENYTIKVEQFNEDNIVALDGDLTVGLAKKLNLEKQNLIYGIGM